MAYWFPKTPKYDCFTSDQNLFHMLRKSVIWCLKKILIWYQTKQECIPVGCVAPTHSICHARPPAKHAPYHVHLPCHAHTPCHACHPPAMHATPLPCMPPMHAPLPCMPPFHACPLPCMPPCHACPPATHSPPPCTPLPCTPYHTCPRHAYPPVDRILDKCFWKYYLAPTSLRAVIIVMFVDSLPCGSRQEVISYRDPLGTDRHL